MLPVIALLAVFSGFTAVCASMKKHERDVWTVVPDARAMIALRVGACALFSLGWVCCKLYWGRGMGTAAWVCLMALAPVPLVFLLSYAPKFAAKAGAIAGVLAAIAFVPFAI